MIKVADWIKKLKYIESSRNTFYDNSFPGNCGLIHNGGVLSFDCIGLVKSLINDPSIATKTSPVGYYVKPGTVIPDTTEIGILQLCTCVEWGSFKKIVAGEYLYMAGHAGVYVGDFKDGSGTVNVIECTTDMGENGVTTTWLDIKTGNRWDHKGGNMLRGWEAHGKLSKYINYSTKKTEATTETVKKEDESMFNDVPTTDKNYKFYKAMVDAGIMKKNSKGEFNPTKVITRGALAVILYRFAKYIKKKYVQK